MEVIIIVTAIIYVAHQHYHFYFKPLACEGRERERAATCRAARLAVGAQSERVIVVAALVLAPDGLSPGRRRRRQIAISPPCPRLGPSLAARPKLPAELHCAAAKLQNSVIMLSLLGAAFVIAAIIIADRLA